MLFSEVYSAYFNAVAAIIAAALSEDMTEARMLEIIQDKAFSESMLTMLPSFKNEEWLVLNRALQTPMRRTPTMPLTALQKRWMKSLFSDPRIALFDVDVSGLEDVEPLCAHTDFVFFDRYADGDPYGDPEYAARFRTILFALRKRRRIYIRYRNRRGESMAGTFIPFALEYSAKDDKFRLQTAGGKYAAYINLARTEACQPRDPFEEGDVYPPRRKEHAVTFILRDERNALDRVMLHFSDCRKETRRAEENSYQVTLWYEAQDETEMLIRILSFGPMLKVTAPDRFIRLIRDRLTMQRSLLG